MEQIEKNTVNAKNQLKKNDFVSFENKAGKGNRIMFVGNSITRHGVLPSIGWHWNYGMAASSKQNDYVHILIEKFCEIYSDPAFCICQAAEWELAYKTGNEVLYYYDEARKFEPDIIIMRICENCPRDDFDNALFKQRYLELVSYLNPTGKAKIVMTSSFWKHTATEALKEIAKENNIPIALLEDLGEDDSMKAIGLFEHEGVANHPGDKGMRFIAERIYDLF